MTGEGQIRSKTAQLPDFSQSHIQELEMLFALFQFTTVFLILPRFPSNTNLILFLLLLLPINSLLLIMKLQTHTVNTMPLIRRRLIPLPLKHMPQMPPTIRADDFCSRHAETRIRMPRHSSRDGIEVSGPAAPGFEFVVGFVERRGTGGAGVDAGVGHVFVVFAGEGGFGAFFADDAELLCQMVSMRVVFWGRGECYLYLKQPSTHHRSVGRDKSYLRMRVWKTRIERRGRGSRA